MKLTNYLFTGVLIQHSWFWKQRILEHNIDVCLKACRGKDKMKENAIHFFLTTLIENCRPKLPDFLNQSQVSVHGILQARAYPSQPLCVCVWVCVRERTNERTNKSAAELNGPNSQAWLDNLAKYLPIWKMFATCTKSRTVE